MELVVTACLKQSNEPNSLHSFTSKINKVFDNEKKIYQVARIDDEKFFDRVYKFLLAFCLI